MATLTTFRVFGYYLSGIIVYCLLSVGAHARGNSRTHWSLDISVWVRLDSTETLCPVQRAAYTAINYHVLCPLLNVFSLCSPDLVLATKILPGFFRGCGVYCPPRYCPRHHIFGIASDNTVCRLLYKYIYPFPKKKTSHIYWCIVFLNRSQCDLCSKPGIFSSFALVSTLRPC